MEKVEGEVKEKGHQNWMKSRNRTRSRTVHLAKSLMGGGKTYKDGKVVSDVLRSLKTEEEWIRVVMSLR